MNQTGDRLIKIRKWLKENNFDAIIIPHDDEYLSEYIPPENERLAWLTGFTGSAGIAIISNESAAIFVDGRYTVQVKQQVDGNHFTILHLAENPFMKWVRNNHISIKRLGFDSRLHRVNWVKSATKALGSNMELIAIPENPIDLYWKERPLGVSDQALLLDMQYTGKSSEKKRAEMGTIIAKNKCDAAFLTKLDSIAWLLNIRGNDVPCNPVLLSHGILYSDGSFDLFINKKKIPERFYEHVGANVTVFPSDNMCKQLSKLSGKNIQLDCNSSNAWSRDLIISEGASVVDKNDPCTFPKACKNDVEVQGMKNCHIRDAIAVCTFLSWLDDQLNTGTILDEGILSDKLDSYRSELDLFKGISFGTISAAGKNAAMCHYNHKNQATPRALEIDSIYLVDSGGQYLDGTTDITRTVAIGNASDNMKKMFTLVLKGHIALGSAQFPEGIAGQHLDTFARQYLWHHGFDFDHGTGHGVGTYLNVHEGPHSIGKGANNVPLKEGMVVSNEPGYYKENEFGIRCENLILVKQIDAVNGKKLLGFENLTLVPFDVRLMDMSILMDPEIQWINNYHQDVWNKINSHVDGSVKGWLENATKNIKFGCGGIV